MEEKYKKFIEYTWNNSDEWKNYYDNLYPQPPANRTLYWKRKFYRLKIDPEFDVNFSAETQSNNNNTNSYTQNVNNNSNLRINHFSLEFLITTIEFSLMTLFLLSIVFNFYTLFFIITGLIIKIFRKIGPPKWDVQYLQTLFNDENFQQMVYSCILLIDRQNIFTLFPLIIIAILSICVYLKRLFNSNLNIVLFCNNVLSCRQELNKISSRLDIGIGFAMFIGLFIGTNSFLLPLLYFQFIRFKFVLNTNLKQAFSDLNRFLNGFKDQINCPNLIRKAIIKIQNLGIYLSGSN